MIYLDKCNRFMKNLEKINNHKPKTPKNQISRKQRGGGARNPDLEAFFNIENICSSKIFPRFFSSKKNEVEEKMGNRFDAEKSYLSIGGVFRAIRANTKTLESI